MSTSIVIISKDRHRDLVETVSFLQEHTAHCGMSAELVVIEEGDQPQPIDGAVYRFLPRRDLGFGYARNRGLEAATGEVIVFVDDDVRPSAQWLARLLAPFQEPGIVAVGGAAVPDPRGLGRLGAALGVLGFPAGGPPRVLACGLAPVPSQVISTLNCAFRRSVATVAGGFDEGFRFGGEDSEFFARLAKHGRSVFVGGAFIYHRQRESRAAIWRWALRRGRAYFRRDRLAHSMLYAVVGPWRMSVWPKLGALLTAGVLVAAGSGCVVAGPAVSLLLLLAWLGAIAVRARTAVRPRAGVVDAEFLAAIEPLQTWGVFLEAPVTRLLIDLGEAIGRLRMGLSDRNQPEPTAPRPEDPVRQPS